MALIKVGSLDDFSVVPSEAAEKVLPLAKEIDTFSVLAEITNTAPANSFNFLVSEDRRGLALQSLQLNSQFQNFLARLFSTTSEIYFLAWAWDMAGLVQYPGANGNANSCLIPLKAGQLREFASAESAGIVLFPPRQISAGLSLRIQVWESRQNVRNFGDVMNKVASAIDGSELKTILAGLVAAPATGGASAILALVAPAAQKLAQAVGEILKNYADDFVDYFEGYFPAAKPWQLGPYQESGKGATLVLNRLG